MVSVTVHYPPRQSVQIYRHRPSQKGHDRFRCRDYRRMFQLTYFYGVRKLQTSYT